MLAPAHDSRSGVVLGPLLTALLGLLACTGPDNLTDPLIAPDATSSLGGTSSLAAAGSSAVGGGAAVAGASTTGGNASSGVGGSSQAVTSTATGFDWAGSAFDATAGAAIDHQDHFNGMGCISVACHGTTNFTANASGTIYQADGTTPASNVQVGIFIDGALSTTYAGSQGNFWVTLPSVTGFATARIALRTAAGTTLMPVNAAATGNCNGCHTATNRIMTP